MLVDVLDDLDIPVEEVLSGDLVRMAVVVASHLDDDQVGRLFGRDVPLFRLAAVHTGSAGAGIGGLVPVPDLSSYQYQGTISDGQSVIPFRGYLRHNTASRLDMLRGRPRLG